MCHSDMISAALLVACFAIAGGVNVHEDNPLEAKFKKESGVRRSNGVLVSLSATDRRTCRRQCLEHRRQTGDMDLCDGVNYHPQTGDCEVCDRRHSETTSESGWEHWDVTFPKEPMCQSVVSFEYPSTILTTRGTTYGMISRDAYTQTSTKFYYMNGYNAVSSLEIFPTEVDYIANTNKETQSLPETCCGSSWLVINHRLLCQRCADLATVMVYDIQSQTSIHTISLKSITDGATTRTADSSTSYGWGSSYVDVEADSTGLYIIWSDSSMKFSISRIHSDTYEILETWHTDVSKSGSGQSFMICGRLYRVETYNHKVTYISHVLDFATRTVDATVRIPFLGRGYNSHTHYDHKEKVLYSWDNGAQLRTKVNFDVSDPDSVIHTCRHPSSFSASPVDLTTGRGATQGYIGKDPLASPGESIFYFMSGYSSVTYIRMYHDEAAFIANNYYYDYTLPGSGSCCGANYNVIGGYLFCPQCSARGYEKIYIYDLNRRAYVSTISLTDIVDGQGTSASFSSCNYGWGGYSSIDIGTDSTGIYIIWPRPSCMISISKLTSFTDFTIAETWHTSESKSGKGQAFMICGKMYLVESHSSKPTTINKVFDFATKTVDSSRTMAFNTNGGYNSHTHYDFRDKVLYVYDQNKQQRIKVNV